MQLLPIQISITAGTIFHSTKLPLTKLVFGNTSDDSREEWNFSTGIVEAAGVSANTGAMIYHKLAQVLSSSVMKITSDWEDWDWWCILGREEARKRGRGSRNKTSFIAALRKVRMGALLRIKLSVWLVWGKKRSNSGLKSTFRQS